MGESVSANGITAKIITRIDDDSFHSSLPAYSDTSVAYAKRSDNSGHDVEQLRVYKDRKAYMDFDWGHRHGNCIAGVVHVHLAPENGNLHADVMDVRYMNNEEIAKYGPLLKSLNPNVRFRP